MDRLREIKRIEDEIAAIQKEIIRDAARRIQQKIELANLQRNELELEINSANLIKLKKAAIEATGDARLIALAAVAKEEAQAGFLLEKQRLINRAIAGEISFRAVALKLQGRQIDLAETLRQIEEGLQRNLNSGGGASGIDKEAQTQRTLAAELTKQFELKTRMATIDTTRLDKINIELGRLEQRRQLKAAEIALSDEDARIQAARLETLNLETQALREQLELQRQRLQVEEAVNKLKAEQRIQGLGIGLNTELQNAQRLPVRQSVPG